MAAQGGSAQKVCRPTAAAATVGMTSTAEGVGQPSRQLERSRRGWKLTATRANAGLLRSPENSVVTIWWIGKRWTQRGSRTGLDIRGKARREAATFDRPSQSGCVCDNVTGAFYYFEDFLSLWSLWHGPERKWWNKETRRNGTDREK